MPAAAAIKKLTANDYDVIGKIADRAVALYADFGQNVKRTDVILDITMCHYRAMPLNLRALLAADTVDFAHDLAGINRHLDHETLTLGDCFVPRYAR
jgi:hypothetical protein